MARRPPSPPSLDPPQGPPPTQPPMHPRGLPEMTTQIVHLSAPIGRERRKRGPLRFLRTLRWRLALIYAGLLAALLVVLGVALTVLISQIL